jgi:hypothetical protein
MTGADNAIPPRGRRPRRGEAAPNTTGEVEGRPHPTTGATP